MPVSLTLKLAAIVAAKKATVYVVAWVRFSAHTRGQLIGAVIHIYMLSQTERTDYIIMIVNVLL